MPVNAGAGTAQDKGWTADAVGLQAAQTYDHESGEPQVPGMVPFRTLHLWTVKPLAGVGACFVNGVKEV